MGVQGRQQPLEGTRMETKGLVLTACYIKMGRMQKRRKTDDAGERPVQGSAAERQGQLSLARSPWSPWGGEGEWAPSRQGGGRYSKAQKGSSLCWSTCSGKREARRKAGNVGGGGGGGVPGFQSQQEGWGGAEQTHGRKGRVAAEAHSRRDFELTPAERWAVDITHHWLHFQNNLVSMVTHQSNSFLGKCSVLRHLSEKRVHSSLPLPGRSESLCLGSTPLGEEGE